MTPEVISMVLGMLLPVPISILKGLATDKDTPRWVVYLLSLFISVATGVIVALLAGYTTLEEILTNIAMVIAAAQTTYMLLLSQTGMDDTLTKKAKESVTMWK